jgi:hypothetical protein
VPWLSITTQWMLTSSLGYEDWLSWTGCMGQDEDV